MAVDKFVGMSVEIVVVVVQHSEDTAVDKFVGMSVEIVVVVVQCSENTAVDKFVDMSVEIVVVVQHFEDTAAGLLALRWCSYDRKYYHMVESPEAGRHCVVEGKILVLYHTADPAEHSPDEGSQAPVALAVNHHLHRKDDKEPGSHILLYCIHDHVHGSVELGRNMEELLAVVVRNYCNFLVNGAEDPWE